jgi:hypothetical protein
MKRRMKRRRTTVVEEGRMKSKKMRSIDGGRTKMMKFAFSV